MGKERGAAVEQRPTADEVLPPEETPWEDPIVAEVHVIRARLWEEAGGTLEGLFAMLQASEAARGTPPAPPAQ